MPEHEEEQLSQPSTIGESLNHDDSSQNLGPLIVDVDQDSSDNDSGLGSSINSSNSSYSTSLMSSILNYQYENGRRYHAYRNGKYPLPNDDKEQDRLELLHHIFRMELGGSLYLSPIKEGTGPARILDVGTGTGIWAIEIAEEFPEAIVTGTDLSPIQPAWVPPNCTFYIDDAEAQWTFPPEEHFDFIHGRQLAGGIAHWANFYNQVYQNLNPGGWLEMQEHAAWITSDDDSIQRAPWTREWCEQMDVASIKFGKRLNVAHMHKQWLEEAGFEDVHEYVCKVPIGSWPKDKRLKEIGRFERLHALAAVEPFTLALYTRVLGHSFDEARVLIEAVRREFSDPNLHLYNTHYFVYGRKAGSR